MHAHEHSSVRYLVGLASLHFQMNSNSISGGNTLVDMSGKNNDATLYNVSGIQTSSSNVPVGIMEMGSI